MFFSLPYIYDRNKHAKYEFEKSLFYLAILEKNFFNRGVKNSEGMLHNGV